MATIYEKHAKDFSNVSAYILLNDKHQKTGIWIERNDTGEIIKRNGSILSITKETLLGGWCNFVS